MLLEDSVKKLDEIDTDYYLFGFSNDELLDLIAKSDEWSKLDYLLAQKILRDRGQGLSEEELEAIKMERIAELSKPEENQQKRIVAGYVFAVLGGFVGMFIGWHLLTHKKTLPNGDSVFAYVPKDRKQGRIIFILGSIFLVVGLLAKILIN